MSGAGRVLQISSTAPQAEFLLSKAKHKAFLGGLGSGKSKTLADQCLLNKVAFPRGTVAWYAPTYDLVNSIGRETIEGLLEEHGFSYKTNKVEKIIKVKGYGKFAFKSMENPSVLVGYQTADAAVDELDTMKPVHAKTAYQKIIARNRQKKPFGETNTIATGTTPEGFRFVYEQWGKDVAKAEALGYVLFRASTYSNLHNLPDDYIDTMIGSYPPQLQEAYINAQFVNMTSGSVYPYFKRAVLGGNGTTVTENAGEALHIGMDFNVYKMAAAVFVVRDGEPYAIGEFTKVQDTPAMIEAIKTRYGSRHKSISVYPDASGANTSSKSASVSDIKLLREAGFNVQALSQNPPVKDRVAAVNGMLLNGYGHRRLHVNVERCPELAECLEQQVYDENGAPDKKAGKDHLNDACGYFIYRRWPVGKSALKTLALDGF